MVVGMRLVYSALILAGCSTDFAPKPCAVDGDCANGDVCEMRALTDTSETPVCVKADDATIHIGQSAPVSGTNQQLGTDMKLGVELAFKEQNDAGGIRGRMLVLDFRDDAYDPPTAEAAARAFTDVIVSNTEAPHCDLTKVGQPDGHDNTTPISLTAMSRGPNAVLAFLGNVGTPTMIRAAPVALETGTVYFGAFTGADKILRNMDAGPCAKFIFNVRAGYDQEAQATMDLFKKRGITGYANLISFDQNDTFGDAGYTGMVAAYGVDYAPLTGSQRIQRFRYTRNDPTSVPAQAALAEAYIASVLSSTTGTQPFGIMMTDTYGAGSGFIQALRQWQFDGQQTTLDKPNRLKLYFSNVSFVGPNALSSNLVGMQTIATPNGPMPFTQDVYVSQVVPNYQNDTSDIVQAYNAVIAAAGKMPSFTSLEGYIDAKIFIQGLLAHSGPFKPESLIDSFEKLPQLSLGLGANASFSKTNHTYSSSVWGTSIMPTGDFKNLYFWTTGSAIQFFE
jgi:ABC-type branched-subunit amino acid transport system substrate-binding protein